MQTQKKLTRCEIGQGLAKQLDVATNEFFDTSNYIVYRRNDKGQMQRGEIHSKYQKYHESFRQAQNKLISHDKSCACMDVARENG